MKYRYQNLKVIICFYKVLDKHLPIPKTTTIPIASSKQRSKLLFCHHSESFAFDLQVMQKSTRKFHKVMSEDITA